MHFNPLPPRGGRLQTAPAPVSSARFQSTPSAWRETLVAFATRRDTGTISIHSLRVEGDWDYLGTTLGRLWISIHSLRVEGDRQCDNIFFCRRYFNPLPPRGGRRRRMCYTIITKTFQSTPSAWRETSCAGKAHVVWCISIHSLRVEGDQAALYEDHVALAISIHSLRVEGDHLACTAQPHHYNFNPLPPRGGRRHRINIICVRYPFQSTPSAWRETKTAGIHGHSVVISIHSLRVEGDPVRSSSAVHGRYFNPLPPRGGRRQ